ncbi:MAG: peptidoglycan DD-metalloendopeptidase family protein [Candidatus Cloacimonetes bacterium]|nr:peptidoglycan DD-metalloendopeptidase family protein [Candidatus Cloacimonadota bacterium]
MLNKSILSIAFLLIGATPFCNQFDDIILTNDSNSTTEGVVVSSDSVLSGATNDSVNASSINTKVVYRWIHKTVAKLDGSTITVKGSKVNLRTIPFLKTKERPTQATRGDTFSLLGSENDFYKIRIPKEQSELQNALFTIAKINLKSGSLNLRQKSNSKSKILASMDNKTKVQLLDKKGSWYLVKYKTHLAYAYNKYLKKLDKEEEYWHKKNPPLAKDAIELFDKIASIKAKIKEANPVLPSMLLEYAKLLDASLVFVHEDDMSATVFEIRSSLKKASNYSEENTDEILAKTNAKLYLTDFLDISNAQVKATQLLESGNSSEAYRVAKIAAYKTEYKNKDNLKLLEKILVTMASTESNPSRKSQLLGEANFLRKSTANQEIDLPYTDENVPEDNSNNDPLATQSEIEKMTVKAADLNKVGDFKEALALLREANKKSQQKSVRVRLALSKQLLLMASRPEFEDQAEGYNKEAEIELFEARSMTNKYLEEYPDNKRWESVISRTDHKPTENPGLSINETQQNKVIDRVIKQNEEYFYTRGKNTLLELEDKTEQKSAKVYFYLSKQYMLLAKSYKKLEMVQAASEALDNAIKLKDKHINEFTENNLWVSQALEYKSQIDAALKSYSNATPGTTPSVSAGNLGFILPVRGTVTSVYGYRIHPIHRTKRMHGGLDIGAPRGRAVKAMANGKIVRARWGNGYGKTIDIKYDNGYKSRYAHLKDYNGTNGTSKPGKRVTKGDVVGHVNSTGGSTGDHLHLEMFKPNGSRTSPGPIINRSNRKGTSI